MAFVFRTLRLVPTAIRVTVAGGVTYGTVKAGAWSDSSDSREKLDKVQESISNLREIEYPPMEHIQSVRTLTHHTHIRPLICTLTITHPPTHHTCTHTSTGIHTCTPPHTPSHTHKHTIFIPSLQAHPQVDRLSANQIEVGALRSSLTQSWNNAVKSACEAVVRDEGSKVESSLKSLTDRFSQWTK